MTTDTETPHSETKPKERTNTSQLKIITANGKAQQIHILPKGTFKDSNNTAVKNLVKLLGRGKIVSIEKNPIVLQYTLTLQNGEPIQPKPKKTSFLSKDETNYNPNNQIRIAVSENGQENLLHIALSCKGNIAEPRLEIDELVNMLNTRGTVNNRNSDLVNENTNNEQYVTIISYSPDHTLPASKLQQAQTRVKSLELKVENIKAINLELLHQNQKALKAKENILKLLGKTPTLENAGILKLLGKTQDALKDPVIKGYANCKRISPRIIEKSDYTKAMDTYLDALYDNLKAETKITEKQITSSTKDVITTGHRALFMFLMRSRFKDKGGSFPYIGKLMGGKNQAKNHATVILACQRVSNNGKIILPFETTGDAKVDYDNAIKFYNERAPGSKFIKKLVEYGHFQS